MRPDDNMALLVREFYCAAAILSSFQWLALSAENDFTGPNVALKKHATQGPGTYQNGYAGLAVDGTTDDDNLRSCSHTDGAFLTTAFWKVDLGRQLYVKGIKIYNRREINQWIRLKNFQVYADQERIYDDTNYSKYNNSVIDIEVQTHKACSSVKILIPAHFGYPDSGKSYLTLCEVEVFAVSCKTPTLSDHVLVKNAQDQDYYFNGTSIAFECERGYTLSGNAEITCIADMQWSSFITSCNAVRCTKLEQLNNGYFSAIEPCNISDLHYDCTIQPHCIDGFKLRGDSLRKCDENGQWPNPYPFCERVTCGYPGDVLHMHYFHENNVSYTSGAVVSGKHIEARCDIGFVINGLASMTCTSDGAWNIEKPYCSIVRCSFRGLNNLSNGYYIINDQPIHNDFATYGDVVVAVCMKGYKLTTDIKNATCRPDSTWSIRTFKCEIVTCSQPTETFNIKFITHYNVSYGVFTNALPFDATIEAVCQNGTLKWGSKYRQCHENGLWDGVDPVCVSICGSPQAINGKLQDENNTLLDVYEEGQRLSLTCITGFETQIGQNNLTCQQDHSWSFLPVCTKTESTGSKPSSLSAVIGGTVGGFVVIIVAVIVIIIIYKKRNVLSKSEEREKAKKYTGLQNTTSTTDEYAEIFETVVVRDDHCLNSTSSILRNKTDNTRAKGRPSIDRLEETTDLSSNGVYSNTETESTNNAYYSFSAPDRIPKGAILAENLSDIVLSGEMSLKRFKMEFDTFPEGLTEKHTEAIKLQNRGKNRYRNMYAYDETRVVLQKEHEEESDYINACYIHGFEELRVYIASQGPSTEIMVDFWKMIWQTESSKIVMLTKLIEEDKAKCDQYWPETGSMQFGHVTVSLESTDIYSDFTLRTFGIKKDGCKDRTVTQFHYTAWPDKGVPKYSSSLVQFRNKVVNFPSYGKGPIVVHCSAGVGRTGTFIALDYLTKQAKETGYVDVVGTVMALRKQRVNLVQTVEQYALIHHALVETLMLSTSALPSSNFPEAYQDLLKTDRNTGQKKINLEFEMLKKLSPVIIEDQYVSAKYVRNRNKNRYTDVLPVEEFMPCLSVEKPRDDGYINAVFLPSYKEKRAFIITQTPLESTKQDFWKLVWEHNVHSIVMMNNISEMEESEIYWPENGSVCKLGRLTVSLDGITTIDHNVIVSMTVELSGERRSVKQIQCGGWPSEKSLPKSPNVILSLMELVQSWQQQTGNKNVLVHCMNGAEKSGLYCVVSAVIDRMKIEQDVAISNVIQDMRNAREQIIPSAEQYQFCHEAVLAYIQQNETYSNFTL